MERIMKAKLWRQVKDKITWFSPVGYRHDETYSYLGVKSDEFFPLVEAGKHVFSVHQQDELLYAGKPSQETDKRYGGGNCTTRITTESLSFDEMIQHIVKYIEPNLPGQTLIIGCYYSYEEDGNIINPKFEYKCAESVPRKFNVDRPSFLRMSDFDELNKYITWFRSNGFNVQVVRDMYSNSRELRVMCAWGHDLMFRLTEQHSTEVIVFPKATEEFGQVVRHPLPYSEYLLWENVHCFDKVSKMNKLPRPTRINELSEQVYSLIQSKFKEDESDTTGGDIHPLD
jgi:hypothetical protein